MHMTVCWILALFSAAICVPWTKAQVGRVIDLHMELLLCILWLAHLASSSTIAEWLRECQLHVLISTLAALHHRLI